MKLPLEGIKVIDYTGVQSGPSCTQMMAWFGAEVLKVERMNTGDRTRIQLRDIPNADALYFTMVNSNKRSLEIDTKTPEGKAILAELIRRADVMVENMAPGALDRTGFTWERIHELNPRLIFGVVKGFPDGSPFTDVKAYENVAQCAGGNASTSGFWDGPPTVAGAALGDSNTGMHLLIGILAALMQREKTGKGQRVFMSMQEAVLNLCRVKLRDQERLERVGVLEEYPQYPIREDGKYGTFIDAVPRGGNAGGGGQPGWVLKCKGWETDPNSYIYFTIQDTNWKRTAEAVGHPEWATDPKYSTPKARQSVIFDIFAEIEKFLATKTKYEAVEYFSKFDVPCSPVLSMKELKHDEFLQKIGSIVEVPHKVRGTYWTVGCPMKFSTFTPKITSAPLLGEHTDDVLRELGYTAQQIAELHKKKAVGSTGVTPEKQVAESTGVAPQKKKLSTVS
jgi:formyl-CoA transferase